MSGRRGIGRSIPSGKFAKNRGTPPRHKPCFCELFSLKSLGHSPAPEFFFWVIKKSCLGSDPQNISMYMYAYSLRFNRQLILCVAVRQKLGGKHAASGESRRPRQQACARSIREKRSSLVSRELFSLHSGAARTAVRQACPSGHRCRCGGGRVAVPTPASTRTE